MPQPPLDAVYTADEAAARLQISRRAVIKLGRNLGACSVFGREYRFSEKDILDIWQAQRAEPVASRGQAVPYRPLSDQRLYESLVELTRKKKRVRS